MKKTMLVGLVVLTVLLSGCAGGAQATPTPEAIDITPVVSVTGKVVPETWANVSAQAGGLALEVLVQPGDTVAAGAPLVRLDSTDAQLAVQQAEAALETAQAQLALLQAGPRPGEIAAAQAQVAAAEAAVSQAAAQRDQLAAGATEAEIAGAQAQVAAAEAQQRQAHEAHEQTMKCYDMPDGSRICPLLGPAEEQARYALEAANTALAAAQAQLVALTAGAGDQERAANAAVALALAQRDAAQAQLDLLQGGATPEEIAVAEATVHQAEAALAAAQAALERCEIRAPFDGAVGAVAVRAGELVVPGQPLVTLGDLNTLRVETTDLDEIDVARVAVEQRASITFDAIPARVFSGRVARIYPMAEPGAGGVNYTVVVLPDELDPAVRWGMTAFVDIEVGE
jgi:HlyD family secretion protein